MSPPRQADLAPDTGPPRFTVEIPSELADLLDEPTKPLDLDAFDRWASDAEGQPWRDE